MTRRTLSRRGLPILSTILLLLVSVPFTSGFLLHPLPLRPSRVAVTPAPTTKILSTATDADIAKTTMPSVKESTKQGLQDKTVFLTGATGGLGTALALQLAACGVKTLILSARSAGQLQKLADACLSSNNKLNVQTLVCDLSNASQVKETAKQVAAMGPIDVLINNGGVSSRSAFLDTDLSVDEKVMQINFLAGAAFCKALIPGMTATGGRVIWISSIQGLVGIPSRSSYAASKFAVQGYTESMRAELVAQGVTVHTVSPGYIRTNLSNSALTGDGSAYGKTDDTTAAGADPADVAVELLDRIVTAGEVDFTIAATFSAVAAIYLRTLLPGVLRSLLVRRFEKSQKEKSD